MRRLLDRARPWLAVAGAPLSLAVLLPPAEDYARRYAFVQAIQFVVFAVAGPALLVLGRPPSKRLVTGRLTPIAVGIRRAQSGAINAATGRPLLRPLAYERLVVGIRQRHGGRRQRERASMSRTF